MGMGTSAGPEANPGALNGDQAPPNSGQNNGTTGSTGTTGPTGDPSGTGNNEPSSNPNPVP